MMKKLKELSIHTHFSIRCALMIGGLVISLFIRNLSADGMAAGTWAGLALIAGGFVWHILFIRCPHCGNLFPLRGGIPKHCPECGKYIDQFH